MTQNTVTINGTVYDARTGKPLRVEPRHDAAAKHSAHHVHTHLQKSRTLNRKYVHKDAVAAKEEPKKAEITLRRAPIASSTAHRSTAVTHFHKPIQPSARKTHVISDIGPVKHHLEHKAAVRSSTSAPARVVKPSDVLKREAITEAMAAAPAKHTKQPVKAVKKTHKARRLTSLASASLAILILGAYLTYLNMPAISTRVAAAQAGINASYPAYQPSGYSLSGPVAYQQGDVTMKFAANGGPQSFTLTQSRSDWDSTAVLDNYVQPQAGQNYSTTTASGLTIYSYGANAVWVNGGILYTISGDAPLSNEQVQRIATSL